MKTRTKQIFLECLRIMLSPVITYCLRHSIKVQDLHECCKLAYLQKAEDELKRSKLAPSVSRLSVMTGLHRRDVTRLYKDKLPPKESTDIVTRVIEQWQRNKRFCTKGGKARALEVEGDPSEFTELIRSVSNDLNPYTILYEMERLGVVERVDSEVQLSTEILVPKGNLKRGMTFLANDTVELMQAVEENVADVHAVPNYHLKTEYDNVPSESVPVIRSWFLKHGTAFHEQARDFLSKHDKDLNPHLKDKEGRVRVVLGGFSRVEEQES